MVKRSKQEEPDDAEPESYMAPKIPKTLSEKDSATRLVVVLEVSLRSVSADQNGRCWLFAKPVGVQGVAGWWAATCPAVKFSIAR